MSTATPATVRRVAVRTPALHARERVLARDPSFEDTVLLGSTGRPAPFARRLPIQRGLSPRESLMPSSPVM
jgi:hypothetical protein